MEEKILRVLTLTRLPGFGAHKIASLIRAEGVDELLKAPKAYAGLIGEAALQRLEDGSARKEAERICAQATAKGQSLLPLGDKTYPAALAEIYDPPPVLFLRGSLGSSGTRVAIVGSRGATPSGRSLARDLARGLAERGVEVVSGLARGVDGSAHEGALLGNGTTLAVLGSSVDVVYPAEHDSLAQRIERQGAVLSELPPGTRPAPAHFPRRNRIIVGLSDAVIMVEAGSRSGALITARLALDEGRDVLAVPGRPSEPLAYGPNLMIRDGATLIRGIEDVLDHLGIDSGQPQSAPESPDPIIRRLPHSEAKSVDQLVVDTGLSTPALIARLAELELEGRIERLPGTLFRRASPA